MINIGAVLPKSQMDSYLKGIFRKLRCVVLPVSEYGFNYIIVFENSCCKRIFKRHNVNKIVLLTNAELGSYEIFDGQTAYKNMLPEFMRRLTKSKNGNVSVTVVDKNISSDCEGITDKLCEICARVFLASENIKKAQLIAEKMEVKYGIIIELIKNGKTIDSDFAVVLDDYGVKTQKDCVVINPKAKDADGVINDFYIPFKVKPPLGISNLVFEECVDFARTVNNRALG